MATLKMNYNGSKLSAGLDNLAVKMGVAVLMYANTEALKLRSYMQRTRPWTDRTGAAKARLDTVVTRPSDDIIRITLFHGVWYGKYLELAHNKNYAVIEPTLKSQGPEVISGFNGLLEKVKV